MYKKGHTETVYFVKRNDDKLTKMASKVSAAMGEQIATTNKAAMDSIFAGKLRTIFSFSNTIYPFNGITYYIT